MEVNASTATGEEWPGSCGRSGASLLRAWLWLGARQLQTAAPLASLCSTASRSEATTETSAPRARVWVRARAMETRAKKTAKKAKTAKKKRSDSLHAMKPMTQHQQRARPCDW